MSSTYPSLLSPPVAFARPATGPGELEPPARRWGAALAAGATGVAGQVHLSQDGVPVIHDGSSLRLGLRRRPISSLPAAQLPSWVARLADVYGACGPGVHLALDLNDEAIGVVTALAEEHGTVLGDHLWLCSTDWRRVASWRTSTDGARLVHVTRLRTIDEGPERRAASLAAAGIDAVRLGESDWNPGLTTLFHRFGLLALAGTTRHRHRLDALVAAGTDGVTSDDFQEMVNAVAAIRTQP